MTKKNTNASRPRISVSDTMTATPPPMATARNVPPTAVTRLCAVAIHVVGFASVRRSGSSEIAPSGAMPSIVSRAIGITDNTATTTTSHPSSVAFSSGLWACVVRRVLVDGSRRSRARDDAGGWSLQQALVAEEVCEALQVRAVRRHDAADIGGHQLDRRPRWIPRRHASSSARRNVSHRCGELLSFVGKDEIDEGACRCGILRRLEDRHGLSDGGQAFGWEDKVDRRALGFCVKGHEVDDDAIGFLAVRDGVQYGAVPADGDGVGGFQLLEITPPEIVSRRHRAEHDRGGARIKRARHGDLAAVFGLRKIGP